LGLGLGQKFGSYNILAVSIDKHQQKYSLSKYQGNYSGKRMNEKKAKKYDDVSFLQT